MINPQLLSRRGDADQQALQPMQQIKFQPGMYDDIKAGALLVIDGRLLGQLRECYSQSGPAWLVQKDGRLGAHRLGHTGVVRPPGGDSPLPPVPVGGYVSRPEALDGQGRHQQDTGRLHPHGLHTRGRR